MERLAGRERNDGVECWVAVTTEAFSQALLSEKPLTKDGAYVPQTHAYLNNAAGRIWDAVRDTLKPFIGKQFPMRHAGAAHMPESTTSAEGGR